MKNKKVGLICIVIGIILIILATVVTNTGKEKVLPEEIQKVNNELNEVQTVTMLRNMFKYLPQSQDINSQEQYKLDDMITFACVYEACVNENNVKFDFVEGVGIVESEIIKNNIEYLFNISDVNLTKSFLKIVNNKIYVPLNFQGGDFEIYKYVETVKDEKTGEYIAVIDSLEPVSADDASNLLSASEYDKNDVMATIRIRYKVLDGRKILLAYNVESKIW